MQIYVIGNDLAIKNSNFLNCILKNCKYSVSFSPVTHIAENTGEAKS